MQLKSTIRKIPADSVSYGRDICTRGGHVWAAYSDGELVCIAATSKEVREQYHRLSLGSAYGRPPVTPPSELDGRRDRPMALSVAEQLERERSKGERM